MTVDTIRIVIVEDESDIETLSTARQPVKFRVADGVEYARRVRIEKATTFYELCREMGAAEFRYVGPDPLDDGFLFQSTYG